MGRRGGSRQTKEEKQYLALKIKGDDPRVSKREIASRVDVSNRTIYNWLEERDFRSKWNKLDEGDEGYRVAVPGFPEFCETYLGFRLFWHQLQWVDVLEGRKPRDLHPAQTYTPGADPHLLLVNTPPGFAKSTTITAAYTLWRILKDPNTQAVIVSKNEPMAKKWMFQIQDWLTSRSFEKLKQDFGPADGFKATAPVWSKTQIYFGPELRDKNAKDPTLEVLGMGGTIYGARADLIILDDVVDTSNAHDFDDQIEWLTGMVLTRPADEDKVLVIGTRVSPVDLYKELMNPQRYDDGESPWTYFAQPAVLELAEEPRDWVTLWPKSNIVKKGQTVVPDEDGLYPKWDGESLARMRKRISTDPHAWALKYQQQDVADDAVFSREAVYGSVNNSRVSGHIPEEWRKQGGFYFLAGLDPASEGHTAAVAYAVDTINKQRYVVKVHNQANMTPDQVRQLMYDWTSKYGIREWRIEKVLLSSWILQDREIQKFMANYGATLAPHQTTGRTKWDAEAGVMSLSNLFYGWDRGENLIELPNTQAEEVKTLCEQLCNFFPGTKGKTDCVMALWFAEVRARELITGSQEQTHAESWWDSEVHTGAQRSVPLQELTSFEEDYIDPWWG